MDRFGDMAAILQLVRRRILYFLLPAILLAAGGSAVVILLPAIYRSQATILVESQQIPPDLVRSTVTALASERLQVIEQRALSRDNILALIDKFGLFADYPKLSRSEVVELAKSRIVIAPINANIAGRRVRDDRLTIAFTISYEDERSQTAARVANELVTIVLNADAKARTSQAAETSSFLERESARLAAELAASERDLSQVRLENPEALPEKLPYNLSLNEKLEKSIGEIESQLRSIEEQKRLLVFEASVRSAAAGSSLGGDGKSGIDSQIEGMRADIAVKSAMYSENHPEMRMMRKALDAMVAERDRMVQSLQPPKDGDAKIETAALGLDQRLIAEKLKTLDDRKLFLASQSEQYAKTADKIKVVIARTPEVGAVLGNLERKQSVLQKSLDEINGKLAQAKLGERLEENQQSERFEVIEQPIVTDQPVRPDRKKLLALVGMAAVAAGGGLALATEFLDQTMRTSAEVLNRLGMRPIATIKFIPLASEVRRRRRRIILFVLLAILGIALALAAVHFLYQPLDIIAYKVMKRL